MRVASCWLLLVPAPVAAQTTVAWKLEPGQTFAMERVVKQDQTVEVRGKVFRQRLDSVWRVHLEVLDARAAARRVRATLQEVQHRLQGTVGAGIDHHLADKLQGRQFTFAVSPHGAIVDFQGYADFVEQAADKEPERARALRTQVPEEALREAFADLLGPLPDEPLRPGATWQHCVREPIPHFGAVRATWLYTAQGPTAGGYHLAYTVATTYQPPASEEAALFRVVKGGLRGENGRGKIIFDTGRGRLIQHERRLTIRGTLTVDMMGTQTPLEFSSDNALDVRMK